MAARDDVVDFPRVPKELVFDRREELRVAAERHRRLHDRRDLVGAVRVCDHGSAGWQANLIEEVDRLRHSEGGPGEHSRVEEVE